MADQNGNWPVNHADCEYDDYWNDGAGWLPIGDASAGFKGTFQGNRSSYSIANLYINRNGTSSAGLFGRVAKDSTLTGEIRNVKLTDVDISVQDSATNPSDQRPAGGLVGENEGLVSGSETDGSMRRTGPQSPSSLDDGPGTGGLVGRNQGSVSNSSASVAISGWGSKGGLAGINANGGEINRSSASGAINPDAWTVAGGLVGLNHAAIIKESFSTGDIAANPSVFSDRVHLGGLVGATYGTKPSQDGADVPMISKSYSTGNVEIESARPQPNDPASCSFGGLVGIVSHENTGNSADISDSYSTGVVSVLPGVSCRTSNHAGVLVGSLTSDITLTLTNSYSISAVDTGSNVQNAGLIGAALGAFTASYSYWDTEVTGVADNNFTGDGLPRLQLQAPRSLRTQT